MKELKNEKMKVSYVKPEIQCISMECCGVLCGSPTGGNNSVDDWSDPTQEDVWSGWGK